MRGWVSSYSMRTSNRIHGGYNDWQYCRKSPSQYEKMGKKFLAQYGSGYEESSWASDFELEVCFFDGRSDRVQHHRSIKTHGFLIPSPTHWDHRISSHAVVIFDEACRGI